MSVPVEPAPGTDAAPAPSRIRILPPELAEQIAAGEVVERPASVVKELVENSLDAGASKVEVTLEGGGLQAIRVLDNGCGMTEAEARLAIQRHATSKLQTADDLWSLGTFGFRGEALPSIAAISRFSLASKRPGALCGLRLELEGGRAGAVREVGMPEGTVIEVRDLFFNTPVRRKFLKTEATETANVSEAVLRLALANPGVHFRLRNNDRTVLDLPPVAALGERVRAALGRRGAGALHEALGEENGVGVQAFMAAPDQASSTARNTFLFVGRRAIRDRALLAALCMAYGELLEKGRYPLAVLYLQVPGTEVDVNVHPQKSEVRFARAQEVNAAVRHVVAAAIARAPWLSFASAHSPSPYATSSEGGSAGSAFDRGPNPGWSLEAEAARAAAGRAPFGGRGGGGAFEPRGADGQADGVGLRGTGAGAGAFGPGGALFSAPGPGAGPGGFFSSLRYVGQAHGTYLVCQAPGEIVLVDQHAAHERLRHAELEAAFAKKSVARQELLFPVPVDIDPQELALVDGEALAAWIERLGFVVEGLGSPRLVLRAVPKLLIDEDPAALLRDAIRALAFEEGRGTDAEAALARMMATRACHSAKRAGDPMTAEEVRVLLERLDGVDHASSCPHGRPVLVRLTLTELERRFGRT